MKSSQTLTLEDIQAAVETEFVGGDLVATVDGKRISIGRLVRGSVMFSDSVETAALMVRIADGEKVASKKPKPARSDDDDEPRRAGRPRKVE